MFRLSTSSFLVGTYLATCVAAQQPSARSVAEALDKQISTLGTLTSHRRTQAIKDLSTRILQQPVKYAVTLAENLAVDGIGDTEPESLQVITTTLTESLRRLPPDDLVTESSAFGKLAELVLYAHTTTSMDNATFQSAVAKLKADDKQRSQADFTLTDLQGHRWNLKSLRGRVVLLNFWATWCPPCRTELSGLNALRHRFKGHGLVILSISEENRSTLKRFLSKNKINYPVLLDPGGTTKKQFLVPGFPQSYVYDRRGKLVAQSIYQTGMQGFTEMLKQAGLSDTDRRPQN